MKTNLFYITVLLVLFSACKASYDASECIKSEKTDVPDYNLEENWAVLPNKYTAEFTEFASKEPDTLKADVFYVYPTLNTEKGDLRWNVPINDKSNKKKY